MIRVQSEPLDVAAELAGFARGRTDVGGIASFVGVVRAEHGGAPVLAMTLEHYPGMLGAHHTDEAGNAANVGAATGEACELGRDVQRLALHPNHLSRRSPAGRMPPRLRREAAHPRAHTPG